MTRAGPAARCGGPGRFRPYGHPRTAHEVDARSARHGGARHAAGRQPSWMPESGWATLNSARAITAASSSVRCAEKCFWMLRM